MSCQSSFVCAQLNAFKYCYLTFVILSIKYSYLIQKNIFVIWFQISNNNNNNPL